MAKWKVDFTGVEDKEFGDIAPGKYLAKVKSIEKKDGSSGYPYLEWQLTLMSGGAKGSQIRHITSLKPSTLFNLRNTLIALGLNVPKSAVNVDPDKLIGKTMGIEVTMRPYEGKDYPNVKKVFSEKELKADVETPTAEFFEDGSDDDVMVLDDSDL